MKRQNVLNKKKKKKGFTLIELIIVIAIIAILAVIAIPRFGQVRRRANINADIANAKMIANAVSIALSNNTLDPTDDATTDTLNLTASSDLIVETRNQLDAIPTGKQITGDFTIAMDTDGNVTVSLGAGGTLTQVYPNPPAGNIYHQN